VICFVGGCVAIYISFVDNSRCRCSCGNAQQISDIKVDISNYLFSLLHCVMQMKMKG